MNKAAIKLWLPLVGSTPAKRPKSTGWFEAHCPLAPWRHARKLDKHPSFGIEVGPGDSRVHCFSCGFSGRQSHVVAEMMFYLSAVEDTGAIDLAAAQDLIDSQPVGNILGDVSQVDAPDPIFPDWWLMEFEKAEAVPDAMAYLASRHVTNEISGALNLRWDKVRRRILFPTFDNHYRLRGVQGRAIDPGVKPPYLNYKFQDQGGRRTWLNGHMIDFTTLLVIVEGPFDLARVLSVHKNTIAACGAGSVDQGRAKVLSLASQVLTMLDGDTAGSQGRERLSALVPGIIHAHLPDDRDPGDMDDGEIADYIVCASGPEGVNLFGPSEDTS